MGFYGAAAALYLCLVGMIETFGDRDIITSAISLAHIMLLLAGLVTGYVTMRQVDKLINPAHQVERKAPGLSDTTRSLTAGIITGMALGLLMLVLDRFNIRDFLVSASPKLLELLLLEKGVTPAILSLLPFGHGLAAGMLRIVVFGAVSGLAGGALYLLPANVRRPIIFGIGMVVLLGLLSDLMRIALNKPGWSEGLYKLLYTGRGLSSQGAGITVVATAVITVAWRYIPDSYTRVISVITAWLPTWIRITLAALLSVSLLLRLAWFLGIENVYPPILPDCPGVKTGNISLAQCTEWIFQGLSAPQGSTEGGLASSAPAVSAAITLADSLMLLGIAASIFLLLVRTVQLGMSSGIRQWPAPPLQKLERAQRLVTLYLGVAALLFVPGVVGVYPSEVLVMVGLYVVMGLGLNVVVGMAGLLDLGYVAFFAVGAYSMAVLTTVDASVGGAQLSFWGALPLVVVITGIAGLLVGAPVLRMRGDYLAIVTLGFGEIARFMALSDWFKPALGGAQGIIKIPDVHIGGVEFVGPQKLYYLILVGCLIAYVITARLKGSRVGRAWGAMREDEQVADVMGVNTTAYKLLAFAMGALIASVSGAIFAAKLGTIYPHSFNVQVSITALGLLIVGGIGSLPGVVVGAFALVGLPELLREFSEYRMLFYGAAMIIMMLVRPQGLLPSARRAHKLQGDERDQDDWMRIAAESEAAGSGSSG